MHVHTRVGQLGQPSHPAGAGLTESRMRVHTRVGQSGQPNHPVGGGLTEWRMHVHTHSVSPAGFLGLAAVKPYANYAAEAKLPQRCVTLFGA